MSTEVARYRRATMGTLTVAVVDIVESLRSIVESVAVDAVRATSTDARFLTFRDGFGRMKSERARGRRDRDELSAGNSKDD